MSKEVVTVPAGNTHEIIANYLIYSSPGEGQPRPLNRPHHPEMKYCAFRQAGGSRMSRLYKIVHVVLLNPNDNVTEQLRAAGVALTVKQWSNLQGYIAASVKIDKAYQLPQ